MKDQFFSPLWKTFTFENHVKFRKGIKKMVEMIEWELRLQCKLREIIE